MTRNAYYRLGLASSVVTVLFLLFGIGALGFIGTGGPHDRMYIGVFAVFVIGVAAILRGLHDLPGASVLEILGLTGMYAVLFAGSGWLFRRSAAARTPSVPTP